MNLEKTIKKYQEILRLQDWEIKATEDAAINTDAQTLLIFNDYKAVIRIKETMSSEEKEKALVHELVHLIFRDAYDIFVSNVENAFAKEYCERQHERAIEKTAQIIYRLVHPVE